MPLQNPESHTVSGWMTRADELHREVEQLTRERDEAQAEVNRCRLDMRTMKADADRLRALLREAQWVYDDSGDFVCVTQLWLAEKCIHCDGYAIRSYDDIVDTPQGLHTVNRRIEVKRPHALTCPVKAALEE